MLDFSLAFSLAFSFVFFFSGGVHAELRRDALPAHDPPEEGEGRARREEAAVQLVQRRLRQGHVGLRKREGDVQGDDLPQEVPG